MKTKTRSKKKNAAVRKAKPRAARTRDVSRRAPSWIGTIQDCSRELNLSTRRIYQLVKEEGFPQAAPGRYDLAECLKFYCRYLQRKLIERALPDDEKEGGTATSAGATRHKLLSIEAELKQIELSKEREQLVSIEKVTKDMAAIVVEIRTQILALPPRLASEVLGETDLAIAQVKIERSLKAALESLSQFDPDEDRAKVS